jgi:hypothetical protein
MKKLLSRFPICLVLGLALAGCGSDPGTTVTPQSSYTTTTPYSDAYYTTPSNNTGTTGNWAQNPYADTTLPVIGESLPAATASAPVLSGVEVQLVSKDLPGMFSWERCEAQITVKNHDATPQQGFLLASFTLKGREVELQYRVVSLSAKGSQTFQMKSTVQADDVTLEFRTKLL